MKPITKLRKAFPDLELVELNDGQGCNLYSDRGVISIWFKKLKVGFNSNWKKFGSMDDLIAHVDKIVNPQPKVAPVPSKTPIMDYVNVSKAGIELAISHIQNKILTVERNNPNNAVLTVLKILTKELEQFL